MICKKCGKEISEEFNMCPFCGEAVVNEVVDECVEEVNDKVETEAPQEVVEQVAPVEPVVPVQPVPEAGTAVQVQPFDSVVEPQYVVPKEFCKICGGEIAPEGDYCTTCGKSKNNVNIIHCVNCGSLLEKGQKFCNTCGNKVNSNVATAKFTKTVKKKKKAIIAIIAAIVALAIFGGVGKAVLPKLLATPYEIMETGEYEKAYNKAKKDEKKDVLYENLIAYCCAEIKDNLKNSNSFELNNVWIDEKNNDIVMEVSGTNSYGGTVTSYYLYEYDTDDCEYQYYNSVSNFTEEEYSYYDDEDERVEKFFNNLTKNKIKRIVNDKSLKQTNGIVERINTLSSQNLLKSVELIIQVDDLYPEDSSNENEI